MGVAIGLGLGDVPVVVEVSIDEIEGANIFSIILTFLMLALN